jgi:hypothetical protein
VCPFARTNLVRVIKPLDDPLTALLWDLDTHGLDGPIQLDRDLGDVTALPPPRLYRKPYLLGSWAHPTTSAASTPALTFARARPSSLRE